ncbi:NUDIX domain-containing protein [Nocardia sp. NPDC101769]|uniref:NUDIX domain-containing protein n=1 Tax=Nocardia sp. NPDC101769 TaxID=3364333 RepID=UPI00381DE52D
MSRMYLCSDINGDAQLVPETELVQRTSVYLVAPCDKAVLLVRDGTGQNGRWDLPGGGLEPGEGRLDALDRELLEETGLRLAGRLAYLCEFVEYSAMALMLLPANIFRYRRPRPKLGRWHGG